MEDNHKHIEQATTDFLNSLTVFTPHLRDYAKVFTGLESVLWISVAGAMYDGRFGLIELAPQAFLAAMLPSFIIASTIVSAEIYYAGTVGLFRNNITGILDNLKLKLGLP